jgi:drug/metabolite transporter (DMT)-like permease
MMSLRTKIALLVALLLWSSAYVAIRAGLADYSPEGLALLRYLVASACMGVVYFRLPNRSDIHLKDKLGLLLLGVIGIGLYNITLNSGELTVESGVSSFIIAQSPVLTVIIAATFLGEKINALRIIGFVVSIIGVALITMGTSKADHVFHWTLGLTYMLGATFASSIYSLWQKPYLKKYHAIEATTYVIWGGTLFLMLYFPKLHHDVLHASLHTTLTVIYLGIFPAAIGYLAWSYALANIPASQATSYLYFTPFVTMLIAWVWLGEIPVMLTIAGGLTAIVGVWIVNHSYKTKKIAVT